MGIFDFLKKGRRCPGCGAENVVQASPEQAAVVSGDGTKYICNNCGKIFAVKNDRR